jgi:chaperonin cofactor prefoldin
MLNGWEEYHLAEHALYARVSRYQREEHALKTRISRLEHEIRAHNFHPDVEAEYLES